MGKAKTTREVLRVGAPIRVTKLRALLDTVAEDLSDESTLRFYNGQLIIEDPLATLEVGGETSGG